MKAAAAQPQKGQKPDLQNNNLFKIHYEGKSPMNAGNAKYEGGLNKDPSVANGIAKFISKDEANKALAKDGKDKVSSNKLAVPKRKITILNKFFN